MLERESDFLKRFSVEPAGAIRLIDEKPFLCLFWPAEDWARLPEGERPATAQRLGEVGWFDQQPIAENQ